ncbi:8307_t:CDS:2 [Racocetra fulgida]|uniref:8307_t:CDS:1 n=1 Tax=Racocetra fulgida TaxID=60492 RepID=A0A9N9A2Y7_9GLOM|nr:8307_t:CDS:2 [Racocetra fulgida]
MYVKEVTEEIPTTSILRLFPFNDESKAHQDVKVPRESVYDAEMYRILHNWLVKVHNFEVTGQCHLEQVCDGEYDHLYCDLAITKIINYFLSKLDDVIQTCRDFGTFGNGILNKLK